MLNPMKKYESPSLPTLEASRANTDLLKKLPHRWNKKAAILACVGVMGMAGMMTLSGCDELDLPPVYTQRAGVELTEEQRTQRAEALQAAREVLETTELSPRVHWGGSGYGPFYVAYFTEQEAFGFIRAKLEAEGLNFSESVPDYSVEIGGWFDFGLDLYDAENRVGLSFISWLQNNEPFFSHGGNNLSIEIRTEFEQEHEGTSIGVFFNPDRILFSASEYWEWQRNLFEEYGDKSMSEWEWIYGEHEQTEFIRAAREEFEAGRKETMAERTEAIRENLINQLTAQAREFIDRMQEEL
jgi:hypothetical protein